MVLLYAYVGRRTSKVATTTVSSAGGGFAGARLGFSFSSVFFDVRCCTRAFESGFVESHKTTLFLTRQRQRNRVPRWLLPLVRHTSASGDGPPENSMPPEEWIENRLFL
jgi:hypothetical protein